MAILVTGATGNVGRQVVAQLVAAGEQVRALTRRPESAGLPAGVEVVAGDLTDPGTVSGACDGIDRLYLFPVPETAAECVARAKRSGVQRIVTLSSLSVDSGSGVIADRHRAVEVAVESAGVEWTHVRPGAFAINVLWQWGQSIRDEGIVRAPYQDSAQAVIHEADIAAVAVTALLEDGHGGRSYSLNGPEALTRGEQVRQIGRAIGRELRFQEQSPQEALAEMSAYMPAAAAESLLHYFAAAVQKPEEPLPTVQKVTGRPGRTFAQWAADHAKDFGG
jgi:uncharacterized protein YbjT (DUF2867 family)